MTSYSDKAAAFRALHVPGSPLLLANAWDVASARLVAAAGARAVATTSAGVAWSLGAPDGDRLPRTAAVELIARIAGALGDVPVTADVEGGYAHDAEGVAETGRLVRAAGAVGVNLEDAGYGTGGALLPVGEAADRITAFRRGAGTEMFVNARIDTFLRGVDDAFAATVERAKAYVAAGADGIFVPGVVDVATAGRLAGEVGAPLNVLVWPGVPSAAEFAAAGVARISLGSSIAEAAYALVERAAREFLGEGTYETVTGGLTHGQLNTALS